MSGIFHEGRWYENTDMICRRCGRPVYDSDNPEYRYQCFHCDEDFYSIEVEEQDALYLPPVMVARPVDGITLNEALEYLLDDTGNKRIPQATQISEAEWRNIADNQDTGYSCFIVVNIAENQVWVNEDTGAGMALYCFPFLAVMEVAASGAADPWETLLAKYPSAKMSG